jgi:hypothetical protein
MYEYSKYHKSLLHASIIKKKTSAIPNNTPLIRARDSNRQTVHNQSKIDDAMDVRDFTFERLHVDDSSFTTTYLESGLIYVFQDIS